MCNNSTHTWDYLQFFYVCPFLHGIMDYGWYTEERGWEEGCKRGMKSEERERGEEEERETEEEKAERGESEHLTVSGW